jgi:hypothetical protein
MKLLSVNVNNSCYARKEVTIHFLFYGMHCKAVGMVCKAVFGITDKNEVVL